MSSATAPDLPKAAVKSDGVRLVAPHAGFEKFLQEKSKSEASPIVRGLIRQLSSAVRACVCSCALVRVNDT